MPRPVPQLSDTPGKVRSLGPELGEHSDSVYQEILGLSLDEINSLRARGTI